MVARLWLACFKAKDSGKRKAKRGRGTGSWSAASDAAAVSAADEAPTTVQASARLPSGNQNQENLENSDKIKTIADIRISRLSSDTQTALSDGGRRSIQSVEYLSAEEEFDEDLSPRPRASDDSVPESDTQVPHSSLVTSVSFKPSQSQNGDNSAASPVASLVAGRLWLFKNSPASSLNEVPEDSIPKVVTHPRAVLCVPAEEKCVTYVRTLHPDIGVSGVKRRQSHLLGPPDESFKGEGWEQAEGAKFSVRSETYMSNKHKSPSDSEVYQLLDMDIYHVDLKTKHIAHKVTLPKPSAAANENANRHGLPALLIINLMVPLYQAKFFGPHDGEGFCLTYYFELPETWEASKCNSHALSLMQRFFADGGLEKDGTPTRDRLKLIPRLVNLEQLVKDGVFSNMEYKFINSYRDKPLLTRPQQEFFQGDNYIEIDIDVHCWAYAARRALASFFSRLGDIVFELGFVVQGNSPDELPEQVFACIRNYRMDFQTKRPLPTATDLGPPPSP